MTPLELQDMLVAEMEKLYHDWLYKNPNYDPTDPESKERIPLQIFSQHIPITRADSEEDPVPYLIVRLSSGDDDGSGDSSNVVNVVIIAGIWDDDHAAQGHRDILNILQKIYQRFQEDPNLNNKAVYNGEFHWAAQEDNYYPFYFGACQISFTIPALRREDEYA